MRWVYKNPEAATVKPARLELQAWFKRDSAAFFKELRTAEDKMKAAARSKALSALAAAGSEPSGTTSSTAADPATVRVQDLIEELLAAADQLGAKAC